MNAAIQPTIDAIEEAHRLLVLVADPMIFDVKGPRASKEIWENLIAARYHIGKTKMAIKEQNP